MSLYVLPGLRFGFEKKANTLISDNSNIQSEWLDRHTLHKPVFSKSEIDGFLEMSRPYLVDMKVKIPVVLAGNPEIGCIILNRTEKSNSSVVFLVTKQLFPDEPVNYSVNFGLGFSPPPPTVNFDEVLRLGRMHLDRVFCAPARNIMRSPG